MATTEFRNNLLEHMSVSGVVTVTQDQERRRKRELRLVLLNKSEPRTHLAPSLQLAGWLGGAHCPLPRLSLSLSLCSV